MPGAPSSIQTLVGRFDPSVFDARRRQTRIRLVVGDGRAWDVVVSDGLARIESVRDDPDAVLSGDEDTWEQIAAELSAGLSAYRAGRTSTATESVKVTCTTSPRFSSRMKLCISGVFT